MRFNLQYFLKGNCLFFLFTTLLFGSCTKSDLHFNNGIIKVDSLLINEFPNVKYEIDVRSNNYIVINKSILPFLEDSTKKITLSLFAKNVNKIFVNNIDIFPSAKNENGNYTFSIPANTKSFLLENATGSQSKITLSFTTLKFPPPSFKTLDLKMDPNGIAPLAGIFNFESDQEVYFSYYVKGQDGVDFSHSITSMKTSGTDNLFALYPNFKNEVHVSIKNNEGSTKDSIIFVNTSPLPDYVINQNTITSNFIDSSNAKTKFIMFYPYKTVNSAFYSPSGGGTPVIIDQFGKIRGFLDIQYVLDMKLLTNGHYLYCGSIGNFHEIDLLGNYYNHTPPPSNCHHDFDILPNGNILYTGEDASVQGTIEDKIYEIDFKTGSKVNTYDLYNILDPQRPSLPDMGREDWFHNNSVCYDKIDNSMLVTGRCQSTIAKISLDTKKLVWMISDPYAWNQNLQPYLLNSIGNNFEYAYGEHSVRINPINHNQFIVFDNGNARSYTNPMQDKDSYSRLVEYTVNPTSKTVTQSFEYGKALGSENYTPALSNVDYLSNNNYFICFGLIMKENNNSTNASEFGIPRIRFTEVDRTGKVLLDVSIKNIDASKPMNGIRTYRAHSINFY